MRVGDQVVIIRTGVAIWRFCSRLNQFLLHLVDSVSERDIFIDYLPFSHIQVLRLAHALVEAGCRLHVSPEDASKLSELGRVFGLRYEIGGEGVPRLRGLSIDHTTPETRVGQITKPLIFPIAVFEYCRARWPETRPVRVSFAGQPTVRRKKALNDWLKLSDLKPLVPEHVGEPSRDDFLRRILRRISRRLGVSRKPRIYSKLYADGVKLILSDDGRVFPQKAWNVAYYASLLESEFVLCPDGQDLGGVPWQYRFFESVFCGAIPVVESAVDAYEGFKFRHMGLPLHELVWSRDEAEHNFDWAMNRMSSDRK